MSWIHETILSSRFWTGGDRYDSFPPDLSVTVVIPAWNEEDSLAVTVESLLRQTYPIEIIIVDDSSTDRTGSIANEYAAQFENIRALHTERPEGFKSSKSQALNYSLDYINTDIFVCVDADTRVANNGIYELMRAFNNDNVMVACGTVETTSSRTFWEWARQGEYLTARQIVKSAQENVNVVLVASGCLSAMRIEFIRRHGFDNRTMAEDLDLTWISIEEGYDVAFVSSARCTVADPNSFYLYESQVARWFSGMFQNIRVRNYNIFSDSFKLGFIVYFYIALTLFTMPSMFIFMLYNPVLFAQLISFTYVILLGLNLLLGIIERDKRLLMYPVYLASMILIAPINYYIYIKCFVKEFILGRTLTTWVKGH